jgi:hypothetical protein
MKTGRTIAEMAQELMRQAETRKDFLAPQGGIQAKVITPEVPEGQPARAELVLSGLNGRDFGITNHAHGQLAEVLGIPKRYYDRMATEQPDLLARNVNTWLHADPGAKRMVRTLDGQARAILSDRYRPLDNFELVEAIFPVLTQHKLAVQSAELTETRMYLKAILPDLSEPLPEGLKWGQGHNLVGANHQDGRVVAAIVISNSEVGNGTLKVEPSVFTTWCTNLAIMQQAAMRKYHVGRGFEADANMEVYRDATRKLDDAAFWAKVKDVTVAAFDRKVFAAAVAQMRQAGQTPIVSTDLPKVVDVTVKELNLNPKATNGILRSLALGGDFTKLALSQAVTYVAGTEDGLDYETATDLERAGGEILALEGRHWDVISRAGAAA